MPSDWDDMVANACPLCGLDYSDWHARECMDTYKARVNRRLSAHLSAGFALGVAFATTILVAMAVKVMAELQG